VIRNARIIGADNTCALCAHDCCIVPVTTHPVPGKMSGRHGIPVFCGWPRSRQLAGICAGITREIGDQWSGTVLVPPARVG